MLSATTTVFEADHSVPCMLGWVRVRMHSPPRILNCFSHFNPAVSFQSCFHIIEIRRPSERTIKMSNRYVAIQRYRFPNMFHQRLLSLWFCKSCIAMMFGMSDITVLRISIYASSAPKNYGGLPLSCSHARLSAFAGALATKTFVLRSHDCPSVSF